MEPNILENIKLIKEMDMEKCIVDKDGLIKDNGKMAKKKAKGNLENLEKFGKEFLKMAKE